MPEMISQRELRNDSGRIMREIAEGHRFVVTSNSHPIAELRPLRRNYFVSRDEFVEAFQGVSHIDREQFFADLAEHVDDELHFD